MSHEHVNSTVRSILDTICPPVERDMRPIAAAIAPLATMGQPVKTVAPLPPCALCGRTEYPVEYGPRHNRLPAGSLVVFDNSDQVWICRRCSRDPATLERLEADVSLMTVNGYFREVRG